MKKTVDAKILLIIAVVSIIVSYVLGDNVVAGAFFLLGIITLVSGIYELFRQRKS